MESKSIQLLYPEFDDEDYFIILMGDMDSTCDLFILMSEIASTNNGGSTWVDHPIRTTDDVYLQNFCNLEEHLKILVARGLITVGE
jgi:hypothetical protein